MNISTNSISQTNPVSGTAVVIGASGGIGSAICHQLASDKTVSKVVAVSRSDNAFFHATEHESSLVWKTTDHSEGSLKAICSSISTLNRPVTRVFIATGVLHGDGWGPEKRIESLDADLMHHLFQVNTVIPALWLKAITTLFDSSSDCVIGVLSARIGSIQDNKSGGWYSYRTSKAALNMVLKTTAVEYARRFPDIRILAFHPGTTDTGLSRPFQSSVPPGKLFSADFVAQSLLKISTDTRTEGNIHFVDWAGEDVVW